MARLLLLAINLGKLDMSYLLRQSKGLLVIALAGASLFAEAASQGTKGNTSSGSAQVSSSVPNKIRISGLTDLALGEWSGSGGQSGTISDICVWSSTRGYNLTATGSLTGGAFGLVHSTDSSYEVPFAVTWDDGDGDAVDALTAGTNVAGLTADSKTNQCNNPSDVTASLGVAITEANLEAVIAGSYAGTINLTVAPE